MQEDISTTSTERQTGKKTSNGKWATKPAAEMDTAEHLMGSARSAYDSMVARGSDLISKVDFSRGTNVIREYPIQSALGGLALGFILGSALRRRQA